MHEPGARNLLGERGSSAAFVRALGVCSWARAGLKRPEVGHSKNAGGSVRKETCFGER